MFYAGINGLQVHQVDREKDKQTSPYTPSSLHMLSSPGVAYTCHAHTINVWKAKKTVDSMSEENTTARSILVFTNVAEPRYGSNK